MTVDGDVDVEDEEGGGGGSGGGQGYHAEDEEEFEGVLMVITKVDVTVPLMGRQVIVPTDVMSLWPRVGQRASQ